MERRLQPELLDSLPDGSPAARHSRRDLRVLNRLLGSRRWFERGLKRLLHPGERVLELGAGGGEIGAGLQARGFPVDGLDRCGRPAAWDARYRWHRTDLFAFEAWSDYPVVIANLFLHHLDAPQLRWLGERLSSHARVVLTSEPLRCRLTGGLFALVCPLIGAHPVTRHDGRVSITAGFRHGELAESLGIGRDVWRWRTAHTVSGSCRFLAEKRENPAARPAQHR